MTLTVISFFREASNIRANYSMHGISDSSAADGRDLGQLFLVLLIGQILK
jgi:hypothetical protein